MSTGVQLEIEVLPQQEEPPQPTKKRRRIVAGGLLAVLVLAGAAGIAWRLRSSRPSSAGDFAVVRRGDFLRSLRVGGTVEAVRFVTISAPMLSGNMSMLVVTKLVHNGTAVHKGDVLVEFDRQAQIKDALDREAEYNGLLQQILKKKADQAAQLAADKTELVAAEHTLQKATLELRKNEVVSQIDAEKNQESLEEAKATLKQLQQTFALKRQAAQAELHTLEIQRDRAYQAMEHARQNSEKVSVRAPMDGMAVVTPTMWRGDQLTEAQEGDQVRSGSPLLKIVNAGAMQVRVKINQADIGLLVPNAPVRVVLDAYPGLGFTGRLADIGAVGQTSSVNDRVHYYWAIFTVDGADPRLMPDLSAAVDVELERRSNVLVSPRDALLKNAGGWFVYSRSGGSSQKAPVSVAAMSDTEAVIQSGVREGAQLVRNPPGSESQ